MAQPNTFYVLGAGTSAGLVPFTTATRAFIREQYIQLGIYPVTTGRPSSPLHDRVARWHGKGKYELADLLLDYIPASTLELLAQKAWSPYQDPNTPPQYATLRKVGAPGVFFNLNLDGLAKFYLRGCHAVFEPHGTVDRLWTRDIGFEERLEWSLDAVLPPIRPKVLPGPEPSVTTSTPAYIDARPYLRSAPAVVIWGYSFGAFHSRMDDIESFEYLVDNQARACSPIFVVSPDPEPVAVNLEDRLRSNRIVPIALYWDTFSRILMDLMGPLETILDWLSASKVGQLVSLYERAVADDRGVS
jgi:hypothetical protein